MLTQRQLAYFYELGKTAAINKVAYRDDPQAYLNNRLQDLRNTPSYYLTDNQKLLLSMNSGQQTSMPQQTAVQQAATPQEEYPALMAEEESLAEKEESLAEFLNNKAHQAQMSQPQTPPQPQVQIPVVTQQPANTATLPTNTIPKTSPTPTTQTVSAPRPVPPKPMTTNSAPRPQITGKQRVTNMINNFRPSSNRIPAGQASPQVSGLLSNLKANRANKLQLPQGGRGINLFDDGSF